MRTPAISILIVVTLIQFSCKKSDIQLPPNEIRTDPLFNETFGTKLDFQDPNPPFTWSNDSRNLYVMSSNGVFSFDYINNTKQQLIQKEANAYVVQLTPDDKELIFTGDLNNRNGYYKLNLSTNRTSELFNIGYQKSVALYVGNNGMFVYQGDIITEGRPCESWDDFYCGVYSTTINLTLTNKNLITNNEVHLNPYFRFENYSPDGGTALLSNWEKCFLFDTESQTLEDSFPVASGFIYGGFHWIDNTIQYPTFQSGSQDISIIDLKNNKEVKRFQASLSITDFIGWPVKSNKVFYTGACNGPGCTYAINELDLTTMTERKVVTTDAKDLLTSPFMVKPSPDGNTIVFNDGYGTYVKSLR
jgi:hypothetical protein